MKAPYPCTVSDCMGYLYININKIIKLLNSTRGSYVTDVTDDRFIIQTILVLYRGSLSYIFKTEISNNYFPFIHIPNFSQNLPPCQRSLDFPVILVLLGCPFVLSFSSKTTAKLVQYFHIKKRKIQKSAFS